MTKPVRTTNTKCRAFVKVRASFQNSNKQLFGRYETPLLYVVYSYGDHWPLFAWDGFEWYENADKCSMTTSHHHSYAHPHTPTTKVSCAWLKARIAMIRDGYRQMQRFQQEMGLAA
jgi:hypothetical protein